ncbi:hypothetical protein C8R44DRAFT_888238 [Mycena epipterygia]|nr:hypothetical protein C8R44DRAFT_888238 [Mycena epipterygia]
MYHDLLHPTVAVLPSPTSSAAALCVPSPSTFSAPPPPLRTTTIVHPRTTTPRRAPPTPAPPRPARHPRHRRSSYVSDAAATSPRTTRDCVQTPPYLSSSSPCSLLRLRAHIHSRATTGVPRRTPETRFGPLRFPSCPLRRTHLRARLRPRLLRAGSQMAFQSGVIMAAYFLSFTFPGYSFVFSWLLISRTIPP